MSDALERQLVGAAAGLVSWLRDPDVTDILINGVGTCYVERTGVLTQVPSPFGDARALQDCIERFVIPLGRRIDAAHPYLDGRLSDGSRFHVVLPPAAPGGPLISIRKARCAAVGRLESFGDPDLMAWLVARVRTGDNVLVAGGTGAGKTTLVARLLDEVPAGERIAIVEECVEIATRHPHAIRLETRPPSPDGTGGIPLRELLRQCLRMRPDRIVLGECRGEEAFEWLQAMNTGHRGCLGTVHANAAAEALRRLEALVLMAGWGAPLRAVREWISSAIQIVVFIEKDGVLRQVREVVRLTGLEGEIYRLAPRWRRGQAYAE